MRVSSDLIFLGKDKKVVIYNYFINRAIMVNKDSAHFIKYNMGKCIETNMIVDENLKILKKNGVIIAYSAKTEHSLRMSGALFR